MLDYHKNNVNCLAILDDGRLVSGSLDNNIIIYNKMTYEPDIKIKEHEGSVYYLTKLSNGILASCSQDKSIKLFKINMKLYKLCIFTKKKYLK